MYRYVISGGLASLQFCVVVELARPLTVQDMLQKLISKGLQNSSVTQSLGKTGIQEEEGRRVFIQGLLQSDIS